MASTTQLPDNPHDAAEAVAKATGMKGWEVHDPPGRDYARLKREDMSGSVYVMVRGRARKSDGDDALKSRDTAAVEEPIALHCDTGDGKRRIRRAATVKDAAAIAKKAAKAQARE